MSFMDLFVPMTAAFITSSIVVEFLHFLLGSWIARRAQARAEEYSKEMAEKLGISPEDFMSQVEGQMGGMGMMGGPPGMMGGPMGNSMTTSSGGDSSHGQYL